MCKCVKLDKGNMHQLKALNDFRLNFNLLNEDFFSTYYSSNFFQRIFLKKTVALLMYHDKYIGYLWVNLYDKNFYTINSLSINNTKHINKHISILLSTLKKGFTASYMCENNGYNINILESVGFKKNHGTIKMTLDVKENFRYSMNNNLNFKILEIGKEEAIRCKIQNEVFKNDNRVPLTVTDIYFDQCQDYYFKPGAILVIKDNKYIGYGQIIIENNLPTIVNVGILKEYRGKGYGKDLIKYLINIVKNNSFDKVNIKVDWQNKVALALYEGCGFKIVKERYEMKLKI